MLRAIVVGMLLGFHLRFSLPTVSQANMESETGLYKETQPFWILNCKLVSPPKTETLKQVSQRRDRP